jgi:hypothetical protein
MSQKPPRLLTLWRGGYALFVVAMILSLHQSARANADASSRVVVDGFAYGQGLAARDAAVEDARRQAVSLWLDANLGSYTPEDAAFFLDQGDAMLLSHRVLYQRHENQGVRLGIEAYLNIPKLRLEAARYFLPRLKNKPRVVFLVGERHPRGEYTTSYRSAAISELISIFEKSGFEIVKESELVSLFTEIELTDRIARGEDAVAKVGRAVRANMVVTGEVRVDARPTERNGNLTLFRSQATLAVVRASDAKLVETASSNSETTSARAADGIRVVVEDAVYKTQQSLLVAAVLASLDTSSGKAIYLIIEGDLIQRHMPEILALLRAIPSVQHIETLRTRPHALYLRFAYSGKISTLVDTIESATLDGITLEPWKVIGSELHFRAQPR